MTSSELSRTKRRNLAKAARERGFTLLGSSDRAEVAQYLYSHPQWAKRLLGLAGRPSALSKITLNSRPLSDIPLVGRDKALSTLLTAPGDQILVGVPGSGKTALLSRLATQGTAYFLVSTDSADIANALRERKPDRVMIDDLDDNATGVKVLVRLRREIGAEFRIVVTDWIGDARLEEILGLNNQGVVELKSLSRNEVLEIVKSLGVAGPNGLLREIVDQSEGVPGLAVALSQAARDGDFDSLLKGDIPARGLSRIINRLLGSPVEAQRAISILGAISLAGDAGLRIDDIAIFVESPKDYVHAVLHRLATGGLIMPVEERVALRPRPLRRYMIREAFYGMAPLDWRPLRKALPNLGDTARELVLVSRAGTPVKGLLEIVLESEDSAAAKFYAGSGKAEATTLLEHAPHLAVTVAPEALEWAPEAVIPLLLSDAVGDERPLHSTPGHPLRLVRDWSNAGWPGTNEAIRRRSKVVEAAIAWVRTGGDPMVALRACAEVFTPDFTDYETDPGEGNSLTLTNGMLATEEVNGLLPVWTTLRDAIAEWDTMNWPCLVEICMSFLQPRPDEPSDVLAASRNLGMRMLGDVASLAQGHPGVLDRLNALVGGTQLFDIPDDYSALCGEFDWLDLKAAQERDTHSIEELAKQWQNGEPASFGNWMSGLHREATIAGQGCLRTPLLCSRLAELVADPPQWLIAVISADLPPPCILPFLLRVTRENPSDFEAIVSPLLAHPKLHGIVIEVLLRSEKRHDSIWSHTEQLLHRHCPLIHALCLRKCVSFDSLRELLHHPATCVTEAVVGGIWWASKGGDFPEELQEHWEAAVLRSPSDQYCLRQVLPTNSTMAGDWLRSRGRDWDVLLPNGKANVAAALSVLGKDQRLALLKELPKGSPLFTIAEEFVGASGEIYAALLSDESLRSHWLRPVSRPPDQTWRRFVEIALIHALPAEELADASIRRLGRRGGPESSNLERLLDEFAPWLEAPDWRVGEVARLAIAELNGRRDRALQKESDNAVAGH